MTFPEREWQTTTAVEFSRWYGMRPKAFDGVHEAIYVRHVNTMVESILERLRSMLAPKATVTWTLHKESVDAICDWLGG